MCATCVLRAESSCLRTLAILPGFDWDGILIEIEEILWLSPENTDDHEKSIRTIREDAEFKQGKKR